MFQNHMNETFEKRDCQTSSKESSDSHTITTNIKRGRGRPKGSKNKPKTSSPPLAEKPPAVPGRGRGRPKGSKNKPKEGVVAPVALQETSQPVAKVIVHTFAEDKQ
jgi:hypothetical protein